MSGKVPNGNWVAWEDGLSSPLLLVAPGPLANRVTCSLPWASQDHEQGTWRGDPRDSLGLWDVPIGPALRSGDKVREKQVCAGRSLKTCRNLVLGGPGAQLAQRDKTLISRGQIFLWRRGWGWASRVLGGKPWLQARGECVREQGGCPCKRQRLTMWWPLRGRPGPLCFPHALVEANCAIFSLVSTVSWLYNVKSNLRC